MVIERNVGKTMISHNAPDTTEYTHHYRSSMNMQKAIRHWRHTCTHTHTRTHWWSQFSVYDSNNVTISARSYQATLLARVSFSHTVTVTAIFFYKRERTNQIINAHEGTASQEFDLKKYKDKVITVCAMAKLAAIVTILALCIATCVSSTVINFVHVKNYFIYTHIANLTAVCVFIL